MEKIIEIKSCKHCQTSFNITGKDMEFYEKVSPVFGGKKYSIPTPKLCPLCRQKRRLSWRNERALYKSECSVSGETIISFFRPSERIVMKREIWFSDVYEPCDYGRDFDFSRSFFEQFHQLELAVPHYSIQQQSPMENSEYCNCASNCKNCYLLFDSDYDEDSSYGSVLKHSKKCLDIFGVRNSELVYEGIEIKNGYSLFYCQNCKDCKNSYWLENCINCSDCFGCKNLVNKNFCIFNQQYTKEEYFNKQKELLLKKNIKKMVTDFFITIPSQYAYNFLNENVSGNNISNSKDAFECYDVDDIENGKFLDLIFGAKNIYDASSFGENISEVYECNSVGMNGQNLLFNSTVVVNTHDMMYCLMCFPNVKYCFGCVGLKNKSYCILNKQYTKEEYEQLVPQIIEHMMKTGEWGEFFPSNISPFGYNETVANEYYPLTREEVLSPVIVGFDPTINQDTGYSGHSSFGVNLRRMETGVGQTPPVISNDYVLGSLSEEGSERSMNSHSIQSSTDSSPSLGMTSHSEGQRDPRVKHEDDNHRETFLHRTIFNWSDYETPFPKVEKIIPADKLPDNISQIPDDILNWAIECEVTQKPFRIIKQELEFYRKHNLPIPRRHPDQRHKDRMNLRNPRKLFERTCDKCSKPIQTTYSPERPEKVYCEECYNKEVY